MTPRDINRHAAIWFVIGLSAGMLVTTIAAVIDMHRAGCL